MLFTFLGLCNNQALSPVACVPTKLRYKKVKMAIKTQYLQQNGPPTNKVRELVLEEHEECGYVMYKSLLGNAPNYLSTLDILFPSNHNIHKSSCGLCFWASDT